MPHQTDATQVTLTNTLDPSISGSVTGSVVSLNKSTYGASSSDVCSLKKAPDNPNPEAVYIDGECFTPDVNVQNAGSCVFFYEQYGRRIVHFFYSINHGFL